MRCLPHHLLMSLSSLSSLLRHQALSWGGDSTQTLYEAVRGAAAEAAVNAQKFLDPATYGAMEAVEDPGAAKGGKGGGKGGKSPAKAAKGAKGGAKAAAAPEEDDIEGTEPPAPLTVAVKDAIAQAFCVLASLAEHKCVGAGVGLFSPLRSIVSPRRVPYPLQLAAP